MLGNFWTFYLYPNRPHVIFQAHYDRELYGKYEAADISLASLEMFPDFDEIPASPEDSFSGNFEVIFC